MEKNIVLLSDGTGNRGGVGRGTNVWRLYEILHRHDHRDGHVPEQIAYYDDGVGTEQNKVMRLLGGAFGYGMARNVCELYTFLIKNYREGDRIYLFGFSRGAYTVRVLSGLISKMGVLDPSRFSSDAELGKTVKKVFKAYTKGVGHPCVQHRSVESPPIEMLGVWDTVGAVGLPSKPLRDLFSAMWHYKLGDKVLATNVRAGYHALAVDDCRKSFAPELFHKSREQGKEHLNARTIEQVWFPGVHSNVGGGYPKDGLAMSPLNWMLSKAEDHGLRFLEERRRDYRDIANPNAKLYDSRAGAAAYYRYLPRDVSKLCADAGIERPTIHLSVLDRIGHQTLDYAPHNLGGDLRVVGTHDRFERPDETEEALAEVEQGLAGSATTRTAQLAPVKRKVAAGVVMYYLFLIASLYLLAVGLLVEPPGGDPAQGAGASTTDASAIMESELAGQAEGVLMALVPDALETVARSVVLNVRWWTGPAFLCLVLLFFWRGSNRQALKETCLRGWADSLPLLAPGRGESD